MGVLDFASFAVTWRTRSNNALCLSHWPHYVKTSCNQQNRKYMTYCIVASRSHAATVNTREQKNVQRLDTLFLRYESRQTDIYIRADHNISHPCRERSKYYPRNWQTYIQVQWERTKLFGCPIRPGTTSGITLVWKLGDQSPGVLIKWGSVPPLQKVGVWTPSSPWNYAYRHHRFRALIPKVIINFSQRLHDPIIYNFIRHNGQSIKRKRYYVVVNEYNQY